MRCEEENKHYRNTQLVVGVLASLSSVKLFKFTCYLCASLNSNDKYIFPVACILSLFVNFTGHKALWMMWSYIDELSV